MTKDKRGSPLCPLLENASIPDLFPDKKQCGNPVSLARRNCILLSPNKQCSRLLL